MLNQMTKYFKKAGDAFSNTFCNEHHGLWCILTTSLVLLGFIWTIAASIYLKDWFLICQQRDLIYIIMKTDAIGRMMFLILPMLGGMSGYLMSLSQNNYKFGFITALAVDILFFVVLSLIPSARTILCGFLNFFFH